MEHLTCGVNVYSTYMVSESKGMTWHKLGVPREGDNPAEMTQGRKELADKSDSPSLIFGIQMMEKKN